MPDGSLTPESSLIFRRQVQPTSPHADASMLHCPSVVNMETTLQRGDRDEAGQSSVAMQVSFLIHLQDPVELLPHVVNIDSPHVYMRQHSLCSEVKKVEPRYC